MAGASHGAGQPTYAELETLVAELRAENAALRERIEELARRLNRDSSNSSLPPSRDQPLSRAERRRRAREKAKELAKRQGQRKPGGQPGHEGKTREMAPVERVDRFFSHLPEACGCGHRFDGTEERAGDPVILQKWELPPIRPLIFQHERLRLYCPCCGKPRLAELPEGVSESAFGPRIEAHIATFAGVYRLSRRQIASVVSEALGIPISVGAVDAVIMRMSEVLKDPWRVLHEAVKQASVVHADETSWSTRGREQWLWLAACAFAACFRIDPGRTKQAAQELLGDEFGGFVVSDRYASYHWLDVLQQQLCWAHLVRQLVDLSQRAGASGKLGTKLLGAAREVVKIHRRYLADGHDLDWLRATLLPLRERIRGLLEQGARSRNTRTQNFCAGLLEEHDALWTFCDVEDLNIPVTNNAAERALRHAVLIRRVQHGTQSEQGDRWVERILSIVETCRLQGRSALQYLIDAATAAHHGRPAPSPLPP
jgi:transposase